MTLGYFHVMAEPVSTCVHEILPPDELVHVPYRGPPIDNRLLQRIERSLLGKDQRHGAMLFRRTDLVLVRTVDVRGADHREALFQAPLVRVRIVCPAVRDLHPV